LPDVSVTPPEDSTAYPGQKTNFSTFYLSGMSESDAAQVDVEMSSGSGIASAEKVVENSGSGDNDSDMVAAKTEDELNGNGSGSGQSSNDNVEDSSGAGFVFDLPEDVTASSANNDSSNNPNTTVAPPPTTTTQGTTTATMINNMNMPASHIVSSNNQPIIQKTEPKKYLPERIRNLLSDSSTTEQTTQPPKQKALINQLYNGRKTALESESKSKITFFTHLTIFALVSDEPETPRDQNQEELPQIFHPSGNNHPRPHQKLNPTTTQPPWHEFTTLYPGQRRTQQTLPPNQQNFFASNQINPQQWIETSNIQRPRK
jgi:hypothetical protein